MEDRDFVSKSREEFGIIAMQCYDISGSAHEVSAVPTYLDQRKAQESSYLRQRGSPAVVESRSEAAKHVITPFRAPGKTRYPTFAIIIPACGRTLSLAQLLDSIAAQEVAPSEVIIVDQNPPGLLEPLLAEFRRLPIKHLRHPQANAAAAHNLGFVASAAAYVGFLDEDMELSPDYVRRMLDCFAGYPAVRCIEPRVRPARERLDARPRTPKPARVRPRAGITQTARAVSAGGIAFERAYFTATGGFDELLFQTAGSAEVLELFLRMSIRGMQRFQSRDIIVYHDPTAPSDCGRRPLPYRVIRKRVAWVAAFLGRLLHPATFALHVNGAWFVAIAVLLRRMGRAGSWRQVLRKPRWHFQLMLCVAAETREFMLRHAERYSDLTATNHLDAYKDLHREDPPTAPRLRSLFSA